MIYPWHEEIFLRLVGSGGRRHHALLLSGPAGTGKAELAMELARARLCESPAASGAACGRCDACGWFDAGNHPDFRLLAPAGDERSAADGEEPAPGAAEKGGKGRGGKASREIKVEQVRALDGFLDVGAHRGGQRVIVVDPADAMNAVAANALLKRLEEPPPETGFILVASRPAALLATIRSRCRKVSLPLPPAAKALAWLVAETGGSTEQAGLWLAAAGGAPLQARRLAMDGDAAVYRRVVDAFAGLPETGIVATADALNGVEPPDWAGAAQTWAADLARVRAGALPRRHVDRVERLRRVAAGTTLERLAGLEARLRALPREASHPLNARLLLEDVLLDYLRALAVPQRGRPRTG
ncbi:DNA polymerase III subunit delta' [Burkholderiaceae bacterium FT117]|uniref:DNA polymerase III subunit delta' n=1 Tax=Zeimonas sediminis TaxID=2944268 RepID=UPI0023430B0F|nr:DNA polymerase III subunit delta' [Zeimonas sediminis]MCM5569249.1 DNA polymerase III subunit delta' [Zeimonas sediminis]